MRRIFNEQANMSGLNFEVANTHRGEKRALKLGSVPSTKYEQRDGKRGKKSLIHSFKRAMVSFVANSMQPKLKPTHRQSHSNAER